MEREKPPQQAGSDHMGAHGSAPEGRSAQDRTLLLLLLLLRCLGLSKSLARIAFQISYEEEHCRPTNQPPGAARQVPDRERS